MKFSYSHFRNSGFFNLLVVNLRYIIGLGFLPSGMIKVLNKPFTREENVGIFFDYLDALFATGYYYNMIGVMQVVAAVLLITQRFATLGSFLFLPIIFNIAVLTISTIGSFTPVIATLMFLGISFLVFWDQYKWINIFAPDNLLKEIPSKNNYPTYNNIQLWSGVALILLPSSFILLGIPKIGVGSVLFILIFGNVLSELKYPVLRPMFYKILRKSSAEPEPQKM